MKLVNHGMYHFEEVAPCVKEIDRYMHISAYDFMKLFHK